MRPLCKVCNKNPAAINGYHREKLYYRSRCNVCIRQDKRIKPARPRWLTAGYKKKPTCDRCGFRARHHTQLMVYHIDGDLKRNQHSTKKSDANGGAANPLVQSDNCLAARQHVLGCCYVCPVHASSLAQHFGA